MAPKATKERSAADTLKQAVAAQRRLAAEISQLRPGRGSASLNTELVVELIDLNRELNEGLRSLAEDLNADVAARVRRPARRPPDVRGKLRALQAQSTPKASVPRRRGRGAQGRPPRSARVNDDMVKDAPFGELVTLPADQLCRHIRQLTAVEALKRGYFFELEHDRRKSVMDELEHRLRLLGAPLGGPDRPPLDDYETLPEEAIFAALRKRRAKRLAADVYAWEHYHGRRRELMEFAAVQAGEDAALKRVAETAAPRPPEFPEPFPGYKRQRVDSPDGEVRWTGLSATPQAREEVRRALGAQSVAVLRRTLEYEQASQRRVIMLKAIRTALRDKGVEVS